MHCPCQSGQPFISCCQPIIQGKKPAKTAEALMRSRYTAYTQGNIAYIRKTQTHNLNATFNTPRVKKWARNATWTNLEVHKVEKGSQNDQEGWVTFTAFYRNQEGKHTIHERSHFTNTNQQWIYTGIDKKDSES